MFVSGSGWAYVLFTSSRAPAGKYPTPPRVKCCPRRGYSGLFRSRSCACWEVVGPCGYGVGEGGGLPFRALIRRPSSPSLPYPYLAPARPSRRRLFASSPPVSHPPGRAGAQGARRRAPRRRRCPAADDASEADLHANPSAAQGEARGARARARGCRGPGTWVPRPGRVGVAVLAEVLAEALQIPADQAALALGALAAVLPGDDDDAPATDGADVSPPRISSSSSGALCRHPSSSPSGPGRGGGARCADTARRQPASARATRPRSFPASVTSSPSPSHTRGSLLPGSTAVSSSSHRRCSSSSVRHRSSVWTVLWRWGCLAGRSERERTG